MDFVWLYVYDESAYRKIGLLNELEYSIQSVKKFGPKGRYFVVGDKPDITHEDVIHIPVPRLKHEKIDLQCEYDKLYKLKEIATNGQIGEEFVQMYDDIFLLTKTAEEDLRINWARAEITNIEEYLQSKARPGTTSYKRIWRSTYEFIWMLRYGKGQKTYDWETHTPRCLNKSKLLDMLNRYDFKTNPMLPIAFYDGLYADNTQIINSEIQADLWSHKPGMDFNKEFAKNYMNIYDNVIVPEFVDKMKKHMA